MPPEREKQMTRQKQADNMVMVQALSITVFANLQSILDSFLIYFNQCTDCNMYEIIIFQPLLIYSLDIKKYNYLNCILIAC